MLSTAEEATAIREWIENLLFGHAHRLFSFQKGQQSSHHSR